jgi:hypothetical protein
MYALLALLLVLLVLIVFIVIMISITTIIKSISSNVLWEQPSKTHLNNVIDNAYYFQKLNKLDLIARGASSKDQYIEKYKSNIHKFSEQETKMIDALINEISHRYLENYQKLKRIPWKIVKFENVENNFPHTHSDIIFLSPQFFLDSKEQQLETLIHEKVHIYQRFYPIETTKLITSLGFSVWDTQENHPNIRTNPDTNSFIYQKDGSVQAQIYNSEKPDSIADSRVELLLGKQYWSVPNSVKQNDHPYEIMACAISQLILNKFSEEENKGNYKEKIVLWIKLYF